MLIAGGGIGGLAAALALARRNLESTVLERSTFGDETGAGIQLGPNATRALHELGVLERVEPLAFRPEAIWLFDGLSGRRLATVPLGDAAEQRYCAPYLTLQRADLHAALLSACKDLGLIELKPGFEVDTVKPSETRIRVRSMAGDAAEGSALIGADGLWSRLRQRIASEAELGFAGAIASRATLPRAELTYPFNTPVVGLWLGPRAHFVHYPVRGGKDLNLVAVTEGGAEQQGWNGSGDDRTLHESFTRWCKDAKSLLEMAGGWRRWSLYHLAPLARWSAGPITLLGDAAHPVLPFLAQGAALAIEDAAALAESLAMHAEDAASAFARYERLRQPRTRRVQREARRFGRLYHLSGPLRLARNLVLRARREERALGRFDWLYREPGVADSRSE
jgi:2-polyprenyl-6-methoxyphenol hydroxylase-like FAD-dependent oxidoreductase